MRTTDLSAESLIGNPAAPPGTKPWALAVRHQMRQHLAEHTGSHKHLRELSEIFITYKGWSKLEDEFGLPFASYSDFCRAPKPFGLGISPEAMEAIITEWRERETAQAKAKNPEVKPLPANGQVGNGRSSDDIRPKSHGTAAEYLVRRLKRDAPEIAEALGRGEYPSARAAGIAAGIVRVPSPLDLLRRAWRNASSDERNAFLKEVTAER